MKKVITEFQDRVTRMKNTITLDENILEELKEKIPGIEISSLQQKIKKKPAEVKFRQLEKIYMEIERIILHKEDYLFSRQMVTRKKEKIYREIRKSLRMTYTTIYEIGREIENGVEFTAEEEKVINQKLRIFRKFKREIKRIKEETVNN